MPQIRVEAYDNGSPAKSDITLVRVMVQRNQNAPRFIEPSKDITIPYSQELGIPIVQLTAEDADTQVNHWRKSYFTSLHLFLPCVPLMMSFLSGSTQHNQVLPDR